MCVKTGCLAATENIIIIIIITAIGFSPGGSSPTLVQTKIKMNKTTITKKQLHKKPKTTK